jgi:hypothetical protein
VYKVQPSAIVSAALVTLVMSGAVVASRPTPAPAADPTVNFEAAGPGDEGVTAGQITWTARTAVMTGTLAAGTRANPVVVVDSYAGSDKIATERRSAIAYRIEIGLNDRIGAIDRVRITVCTDHECGLPVYSRKPRLAREF